VSTVDYRLFERGVLDDRLQSFANSTSVSTEFDAPPAVEGHLVNRCRSRVIFLYIELSENQWFMDLLH